MAKKPSSGATPIKHARAWVESNYPGAPLLEAQKSVVWIFDPKTQERRPISRREDLFGCFDMMILRPHLRDLLIQVTTDAQRDQNATARKRKIENLYVKPFPEQTEELWIIAWVAKRHFKRWRWDWENQVWARLEPILSPLIKRPLATPTLDLEAPW